MKRLQTPYIAVTYEILEKNIQKMQSVAEAAGVQLIPHIKTHKSDSIANLQRQAGANYITVSKPEEAIAFLQLGFSSIKICYPLIHTETIITLLEHAQNTNSTLYFVLDSLAGCSALEHGAKAMNNIIEAYIEIDTGLHRCGLSPRNPELAALLRSVYQSEHLTFRGITSHAGQAYKAKTKQEAQDIAEQEQNQLMEAKNVIMSCDIAPGHICVGATPTLWCQKNFDGITQIKPGNYIFNDLTQKHIGVVSWDQLALSVITTVVSVNDTYLVVDAGSKTLSSDTGAHGTFAGNGYGWAFQKGDRPNDQSGYTVEKLSEEHGWIRHGGKTLPVGTEMTIYPNHACPIVNLFDEMHIFKHGEFMTTWPVIARGCVH